MPPKLKSISAYVDASHVAQLQSSSFEHHVAEKLHRLLVESTVDGRIVDVKFYEPHNNVDGTTRFAISARGRPRERGVGALGQAIDDHEPVFRFVLEEEDDAGH